jgi:uncharacterized protein (DUF433 family)
MGAGLLDRIIMGHSIFHGKACIKGTRAMVAVMLDSPAVGDSEEGILRNYPSLKKDDVKAALEYAAQSKFSLQF